MMLSSASPLSLFKSTESLLRESIISNDVKQVKKLLERDEAMINRDISEGDSLLEHRGYAPIHYVCEYNTQLKIIEFLVKKKASVNLRTNNEDDRSTPLHVAIKFSKLEMIQYLLSHQANADETDYLGETVLMKAAFRNELSIMDALLMNRANINAKDFRGQTALMMAIKGKQIAAIQSLLSRDSLLINEQDNMGNTALIKAVQQSYLEAVYLLLQHRRIDVNVKNQKEETALMIATAGGYSTIVEWLLQKEASCMSTNAEDETALDILHRHKSLNPLIRDQIHRLLIKAEDDEMEECNQRESEKQSPTIRTLNFSRSRDNSVSSVTSSTSPGQLINHYPMRTNPMPSYIPSTPNTVTSHKPDNSTQLPPSKPDILSFI